MLLNFLVAKIISACAHRKHQDIEIDISVICLKFTVIKVYRLYICHADEHIRFLSEDLPQWERN